MPKPLPTTDPYIIKQKLSLSTTDSEQALLADFLQVLIDYPGEGKFSQASFSKKFHDVVSKTVMLYRMK